MNRRAFLGSAAALGSAAVVGTGLGLFRASRPAAGPWASGPPQGFIDDLTARLQSASVPGAWVAWIEGGAVAWSRGFGVRNATSRAPVDADTIFEAASLTKQVTAHLAHLMIGEGRLDLDTPLNTYIGASADPAAAAITARHVLSHSSGLPNWRSNRREALTPAFPPGTQYRYSGEGFVYLSRALETIADHPFGELVQHRVFDPLGMTSSSLSHRPERESRTASGHDSSGQLHGRGGMQRQWEMERAAGAPSRAWRYADSERALVAAGVPPLPNRILPNAAASLCTTGPDYAAFVRHAIGTPALRQWQTTIREGDGWRLGVGLGWALEQIGDRTWLWQWGNNTGYRNFVAVDPVAGRGVLVFTNGDAGMRICERIVADATGVAHPAFEGLS